MRYKLIRWGAFLAEICFLLMFYSASLLAPIPFGFMRIGCILFSAAGAYTFAYFASSPSNSSAKARRLSFKHLILNRRLQFGLLLSPSLCCS